MEEDTRILVEEVDGWSAQRSQSLGFPITSDFFTSPLISISADSLARSHPNLQLANRSVHRI